MSLLTKEQILSAQDLKTEEVEVEEWGGTVLVRTLTAGERDEYEASMFEGEGNDRKMILENLRAKLVSRTVVDESGNLLFTMKDVNLLTKKSASAIDKIFSVAQKLSGLKKEDVDEMVKNLEKGQSEDSISN